MHVSPRGSDDDDGDGGDVGGRQSLSLPREGNFTFNILTLNKRNKDRHSHAVALTKSAIYATFCLMQRSRRQDTIDMSVQCELIFTVISLILKRRCNLLASN